MNIDRSFKFCYPDANTFDKIIKVKALKDWKYDYVELAPDVGYWVAEAPFYDDGFELFKNLVASFPIQKDNNHPDNFDPNPFDTIHLPEWVHKNICFLLRDFNHKHISADVFDPQIHEWGNLYFKERAKPLGCYRLPHIDYVHGLVSNLWFTDHKIADSSTKLFKYHGTMKNEVYDFQIDTTHPMRKAWEEMAILPTRLPAWSNLSNEEMAKWGFEFLGESPCTAGTMTLYKANVCHVPFVSENVDFRWSHSFAYSYETPPTMRSLGGFF